MECVLKFGECSIKELVLNIELEVSYRILTLKIDFVMNHGHGQRLEYICRSDYNFKKFLRPEVKVNSY